MSCCVSYSYDLRKLYNIHEGQVLAHGNEEGRAKHAEQAGDHHAMVLSRWTRKVNWARYSNRIFSVMSQRPFRTGHMSLRNEIVI